MARYVSKNKVYRCGGSDEKESIGHGVKVNIQINISDWLRSNLG
jgi:hypothetical protein